MATPPPLTDEQRAAALARAAEVRQLRAELKNDLKDGELSLQDLLVRAENDEVAARTKVLAVLESLPGVGKVTARRTLDRLGIAESRRLAGLGRNQRIALLETFPD